MSTRSPLARLHDHGQSFWWDSLSRRAIDDGTIARLRDHDDMRGITSNPSIFQAAIGGSDDYDEAIAGLAAQGKSDEEIFWDLAIRDIQDACAILRPVYDASDGVDGYVSLEVDPHLSDDTAGTQRAVEELWARVDRPNLMIKIPGTPEGMPAIRAALAAGRNVNVTLLFAPEAHVDVMQAYLEALEERLEKGLPLERVASVASFFVSRVDGWVDKKLDALGSAEAAALRGKAAIANAKLAYQNFLDHFAGPRWERLAAAGARVQRPLWASTSTKDPSYPDTLYVDTLIGRDTVNTIPTATVDAYRDHGTPGDDRILERLESSSQSLRILETIGVSMVECTAQLLDDGVSKFEQAFDELLETLRAKARQIRHGSS